MDARKFIISVCLALLPLSLLADNPFENMGWDILLKDVNMRYRYDAQHNAFVQVPRFGRQIRALEGS